MNCDISLSTVADAAGLSPSYLSMLFKKETGQNFSEHLTNVRIHKAKELLGCTSKMVYEVAYDVGFRDYRYFSQIFKKYTGQTPRQFQNSANICP
jgi:two-component system response regulator YesN